MLTAIFSDIDEGSFESCPFIASSIIAASLTVLVIGPTWSRDQLNGKPPSRLTSPYVGFIPTVPHIATGRRTDPAVSVPTAPSAIPTAVATAHPPLAPPG